MDFVTPVRELPLVYSIIVSACSILVAAYMFFLYGRILSHHGENGWKILIPFYGMYLLYKKTADCGGLYWTILGIGIVSGIFQFILGLNYSAFFMILSLFFIFLYSINLADAYDRKIGFAFGLFLLPVIFYSILAFPKKEENPALA